MPNLTERVKRSISVFIDDVIMNVQYGSKALVVQLGNIKHVRFLFRPRNEQ